LSFRRLFFFTYRCSIFTFHSAVPLISRRAKLIVLSILLVLLAIPIWHVGSNWAPAERLISRERLARLEQERDGKVKYMRMEQVEIAVRNTSTAPRFLKYARIPWYSGKTNAPCEAHGNLVEVRFDEEPVIPPGGTWRGSCDFYLPESTTVNDDEDPGYVRVEYTHASTLRKRVFTWYESLCFRYFPESPRLRSVMLDSTQSSAILEDFP
jgi:hypothetical protein